MRVYELSKQLGVSSKDLLEVLEKKGTPLKSHMSVLDENSIALLRTACSSKQQLPHVKDVVPEQAQKDIAPSMQSTKISQSTVHEQQPSSSATDNAAQTETRHVPVVSTKVFLEPMTVYDISNQLNIPINNIILTLLGWKVVATRNQRLPVEVVGRLIEHYGAEAVKRHEEPPKREAIARVAVKGMGPLETRLPIIVVLGHVDHGKTTLLDFIRKTRVVAREKGGITQHLSAYEARTDHGNLVFLDTPGHEAFPKMRQRGIRVADIGVLVVAADDGIMPQTVEAIKSLKAMKVPIVVAINKIDKVDASRIEVVKRQLAEQDLLPEEWGGQTVCVSISALTGKGVDHFLEMLALYAQLLELRASYGGNAHGFILESNLERGRGPVATVILQQGTLKIGDYFICGAIGGKVNSIRDSFGKAIQHVGPSVPVQVAGFEELPEVGELLRVVSKDELRREKQQKEVIPVIAHRGGESVIHLVVKTDSNSSKEALTDAIYKLSKKSDIGFSLMYSGIGDVNESDVELAHDTGSLLIGLHVKAETNASLLAQRRGLTIHLYDVIYQLLEFLELRSAQEKPVETVRTKIGEAVVRRVFDIKGVGIIAGSYVRDGKFVRDGYVIAWRGRQKIGAGAIVSLQREKKTVKEVYAGYECGFVVDSITDWQVDDRVECFVDLPVSK